MSEIKQLLEINFLEYEPSSIIDMTANKKKLLIARENNEISLINIKTYKTEKTIGLKKSLKIKKVFFGTNSTIYIITENSHILGYDSKNTTTPIFDQKMQNQTITDAYYEKTQKPPTRKTSYTSDLSESEITPQKKETQNSEYISLTFKSGTTTIYKNQISETASINLTLFNIITNFTTKPSEANTCYSNIKKDSIIIAYSPGQLKKYNMINTPRNIWQISISEVNEITSLCCYKQKFCFAGMDNGELFVLETDFGVILQSFHNSKSFVKTILGVGERVYYSGQDSRVFAVEFDTEKERFLGVGFDRGQSHCVNSVVCVQRLEKSVLVSAGVNSDLCFYDVESGVLEQGGKKFHKFYDLRNFVFFMGGGVVGYYHGRVVSFLKVFEEGGDMGFEVLFRLKSDEFFSDLSFCQKFNLLAVLNSHEKKIVIYNITKTKKLKEIKGNFVKILFCNKNLITYNQKTKEVQIFDSFQGFKKISSIKDSKFEDLKDLDEFTISKTGSMLLLTNYSSKKSFLIKISSKEILEVSHLLQNDNVNLLRFFGKSNNLFVLYNNNNFKKYDIFKNRLIKIELKNRIGYNFGLINNVVFNYSKKNQFYLYSDYYVIFVDFDNLKFKAEKKKNPILFSGNLNENQFFLFSINWKDVVKFKMEKPFDTKVFIN